LKIKAKFQKLPTHHDVKRACMIEVPFFSLDCHSYGFPQNSCCRPSIEKTSNTTCIFAYHIILSSRIELDDSMTWDIVTCRSFIRYSLRSKESRLEKRKGRMFVYFENKIFETRSAYDWVKPRLSVSRSAACLINGTLHKVEKVTRLSGLRDGPMLQCFALIYIR